MTVIKKKINKKKQYKDKEPYLYKTQHKTT